MPADYLLAECIRSGQASAEQVARHVAAGELPITFAGPEPMPPLSGDFTVVPNDKYARLMRWADDNCTTIIESYASRFAKKYPTLVYDITEPDEEELPHDTTMAGMASELAMAAAHLTERGLIVRPWADSPHLVTFCARA